MKMSIWMKKMDMLEIVNLIISDLLRRRMYLKK